MLNFLRKNVGVLALLFALLLSIDAGYSSLSTCKVSGYAASAQQAEKNCSVFEGPIISGLAGLAVAFDDHGEAVIAAFTVVLAIATAYLWRATRDLVEGAERTAQKQLRAYVFAEPIFMRLEVDLGKGKSTIAVRYRTKNWGQTPAYRIRNAAFIRKMPYPLPQDYVVESPKWDDPKNVALGPGQEMFGNPIDTYEELPEGERYYIIGLIEYWDTFGITKRTTRFCSSIPAGEFIKEARGRLREDEVAFEIAPQHNDAD